jgi:lipoprotein-releasing system permease protein
LKIDSLIANRLVFRKNTSFSGFIMRLSIIASAISVAIMIVTLGFVAGFQEAISKKVFGFWGHIRVHGQPGGEGLGGEEIPLQLSDTVYRKIVSAKGVLYADAVASKAALLKSSESMEGVLLKGVTAIYTRDRIIPFMKRGRFLSFDSSFNSVVISEYTARQLQLDTGSRAMLYFVSENQESPRVRPVQVTGIYATGIEEYDKSFVLTEMPLIQSVNQWKSDQTGSYEVTISDPQADLSIGETLLDQIPLSWYVSPVRTMFPNIFDWLHLQNTNRQLIIIIMCIVAIINLVSCLLILVLERTKMIGLLKALGATNRQVQNVFWRQGWIITISGIFLGTLLGLLFCFLQQQFGWIQLDETAYYISVAPVKIIWWQVLLVQAGTFLVAFIILMLPALLVRTIRPVAALRFD